MWTRDDYMRKACTHQQYYQEIADELGVSFANHPDLVDHFVRCIQGGNVFFNENEPVRGLALRWWDNCGAWMFWCDRVLAALMRRNEIRSQATVVCILKAAAYRDAKEAMEAK